LQVEIDQDSLGDQLLPNFYAEDQTNAMNQERRREGKKRPFKKYVTLGLGGMGQCHLISQGGRGSAVESRDIFYCILV
jgi:hypothetical protein